MANRKKVKEDPISNGGELTDYPNPKWAKFFDKFPEIETLPLAQWKPVHLLAYFCKKYEEAYNVKYQFKFNSPNPTNCFEIFQIKKLALLLSTNPEVLKPYIDWVYQVKVEKGKRRLTSVSFMTHEGLVNDYKVNVLLSGKKQLTVDRSTPLPEKIKEFFKHLGPINTYGDLTFLYQSYKAGSLDASLLNAFPVCLRLAEVDGFDAGILDRIV